MSGESVLLWHKSRDFKELKLYSDIHLRGAPDEAMVPANKRFIAELIDRFDELCAAVEDGEFTHDAEVCPNCECECHE